MGASLTEFLSVWSLGGEADLNLSTKNVSLKTSFNICLGNPGAPFPLPQAPLPSTPPLSKLRYRSPTEKERNCQRAARHQADKSAVHPTSPVSAKSKTTVITDSVNTSTPSISSVEISSVATPSFKCDVCELTTYTRQGVKTHMGHKHKELLCDDAEGNSLELSLLHQERQEEHDSTLLTNSTLISVSKEDQILKNTKLQCYLCDLNFDDPNELNDHKISEHSKVDSPNKNTKEEDVTTYPYLTRASVNVCTQMISVFSAVSARIAVSHSTITEKRRRKNHK